MMVISYLNQIGRRRKALRHSLCFFLLFASLTAAQIAANSQPPKVIVDNNGTVHVPSEAVPMSAYLSSQAKVYVTQHLKYMQDPAEQIQVHGLPRYMKQYLDRQEILFPTKREETRIAGVHVYIYTPESGIPDKNRDRVLIELHGGGFSGCWPGCAELESMPVANLGRLKVVAVDYREGPDHKFPAASEDVALVYKELLKSYRAENVGIFGCSAGGMLTAMSIAWFQKHNLPNPGAVGIFCAGAGAPVGVGLLAGDSAYIGSALGEARVMISAPNRNRSGARRTLGYFEGTNPADPLVNPINSPEILSNFPPTLIISGTRDFALSGALYTHAQLVKHGVDAELHVWEGLFHGFFYNPDVPESKDAYSVMIKFFDTHLGKTNGRHSK